MNDIKLESRSLYTYFAYANLFTELDAASEKTIKEAGRWLYNFVAVFVAFTALAVGIHFAFPSPGTITLILLFAVLTPSTFAIGYILRNHTENVEGHLKFKRKR